MPSQKRADRGGRIEPYAASFDARAALRGGEPTWLGDMRRVAMDRFTAAGFPTTRDEAWRYTSVERLAREPFALMAESGNGVDALAVRKLVFGMSGAPRLVFVNGRLREDLSAAGTIRMGSLARLLREDPAAVEPYLGRRIRGEAAPFLALNTAFWEDGAFVLLDEDVLVPEPIHVVYVSATAERTVVHPRTLVVAGKGAQATLIETYIGREDSPYWVNPVTEVVVGDNAAVEHVKIQREGGSAFHMGTLQADLARDSRFASRSISLGGSLVRNDVDVLLGAPGGDCTLDGLYVLTGEQHEDNHTMVDHAQPHCSSRELYKGVLDDRSRGVFNGAVVVRKDAQKTDARQTNRNLLLSDEALVDTKPQLEIFADDVKCAHGATVGQLDENSLFYLRTRGLDPAEARRLLIHAFAAEVLGRVRPDAVREGLAVELAARLPGHLQMEETS